MQTVGARGTRGRGAHVLALALAVVIALAACSSPPAPLPAPDGIDVSVQQHRLDIARGRMTVDVRNDGSAPVTLTAVTYSDPRWASTLSWTGAIEIPAGRTRSVGADVLPPSCAASAAGAAGAARLVFQTARGAASADYAVDDPFDFVARAAAQACFAARLASVADITLADVTVGARGADQGATLSARIVNHGEQAVRIDSVKSTTLLQPASGSWLWTPAETVEAGQSAVVVLDAAPARCDIHALAEDKVGTRFDTTVSILGDPVEAGTLTLVATDAQRALLYDFVASTCGFAG